MSASGLETEVKFYVRDLNRIRTRLEELDARLAQERVLETNIRFDRPDATLRAEGRVLRLRRDTSAKFTYKSPSINEQGVLSREEIEFEVGDFEKARLFLEALGYQKLVYYEKHRTTYAFHDALVMLDELPYGNFVEIEGDTVDAIHAIADELHLKWETAIGTSYNALFERVRKNLNLVLQDLSFTEFVDVQVDSSHLGVYAADA